ELDRDPRVRSRGPVLGVPLPRSATSTRGAANHAAGARGTAIPGMRRGRHGVDVRHTAVADAAGSAVKPVEGRYLDQHLAPRFPAAFSSLRAWSIWSYAYVTISAVQHLRRNRRAW